MAEPYQIQYAEAAIADLKALRAYDQRIVLDGIEAHLQFEPRRESKSRIKGMVQPFWSQFRLRIEDFRVYYDVVETPRTVNVLRVLEKTTGATPEMPT
jgi:mRNA interferase RelE/StbE